VDRLVGVDRCPTMALSGGLDGHRVVEVLEPDHLVAARVAGLGQVAQVAPADFGQPANLRFGTRLFKGITVTPSP
jgi:hypothetical protein